MYIIILKYMFGQNLKLDPHTYINVLFVRRHQATNGSYSLCCQKL